MAQRGGAETSAVPNNKRQHILDAAVTTLMSGRDIKVTELANEVGVTAGLIYRYFADKDELVAEAYAKIALGRIADDVEAIKRISTTSRGQAARDIEVALVSILNVERESIRWARLEALGHYRLNPALAERVGEARFLSTSLSFEAVVERFGLASPADREAITALSVILSSLPLGYTALGCDENLSDDVRALVAHECALLTLSVLERVGVTWPEP